MTEKLQKVYFDNIDIINYLDSIYNIGLLF